MRFIVNHDLHIHSMLSECSNDPAQNPETILAYAEKNNFTDICLTDHFWDSNVPGASDWYKPQNYEHISQALPLPQSDKVRFHFGCEVEMDKYCTVSISDKLCDKMDFIIVPVNHFHMYDFTIDKKDDSPERRADAFVTHIRSLLEKDLPFHKVGIAHLCASSLAGMVPGKSLDHLPILDMIDDRTFRELFEIAAKKGVGIELNVSDAVYTEHTQEDRDRRFRMFKIAKQCGCKFYLGSDAHFPQDFEKSILRFEGAVDALDLKETDKFDFGSIRRV